MFIQDRDSSRRFFIDIWHKHQVNQPMQAMEAVILDVILEHPEYHEFLQEDALSREFSPDQGRINPFLHMGMHITLREQVSTDRPVGIKLIYEQGIKKLQSVHEFEHKMMECLGETLWNAQQNNTLPDEAFYLECLKRLI